MVVNSLPSIGCMVFYNRNNLAASKTKHNHVQIKLYLPDKQGTRLSVTPALNSHFPNHSTNTNLPGELLKRKLYIYNIISFKFLLILREIILEYFESTKYQ